MSANCSGELIVDFFEYNEDGIEINYAHFAALPFPSLETAYSQAGPFGMRSGSIERLRVVD